MSQDRPKGGSHTTMDAPPARGSGGRAKPRLCIVVGDRTGESHVLRVGRHVVGREADDILLADPRVSRVHATVHVASRNYKVRISDEGSRHGTFVNGRAIDEVWLEDRDVIRVGDTFAILRHGDEPDDHPIDELIGTSPEMAEVRRAIAQVAPHDVTVMIHGESGTGKELVARAIHDRSGRRGAFIALNCAAIPRDLAESQLFGHVAGAFTGASKAQPGFFRAADGGTVFLDEIGDMPSELQPKLLRALEQRTVIPVGSTTPIAFDARVVVATHRDLQAAMQNDAFRGDLYARLAEFQLSLPPLRLRREDIAPLLHHALGAEHAPIEPELMSRLLTHPWPFNVRELFAVASELRVRGADAAELTIDMVTHRLTPSPTRRPQQSTATAPRPAETRPVSSPPRERARKGSQDDKPAPPTRAELEAIIAENKGNVRAISRATGRSRMQVYRWVEQYGFDLARYRDE